MSMYLELCYSGYLVQDPLPCVTFKTRAMHAKLILG